MQLTTQEIREALVPRLMELSRAGCKVFIEIDNLMYQVNLVRGIPHAKFCMDGSGLELNAEFFRNMFDEEGYGVDITLTTPRCLKFTVSNAPCSMKPMQN